MRKKMFSIAYLFIFILITGCDGGEKSSGPEETTAPAASSAAAGSKTVDAATAGTVKGKIVCEGEAPSPKEIAVKGKPECAALHAGGKIASEELLVQDGKLQNAFVYVKSGLEEYRFEMPAAPVQVSNLKCVYTPHVLGAQVNQPVMFLNEDPTLHNIHSYSKASPSFNIGLPFQGIKQTKKFSAPEVMVALKCDVHPWMIGYIGILPHPYFSVTDAEGNFELKNLPAGEYTIEVWHEKCGTQSQTVGIGPQETKEIEFKFTSA